MNKLYYGNGECTIEGSVRGVEIYYSGGIIIERPKNDGFVLKVSQRKILIFPFNTKNTLKNLFTYRGTLRISRVKAVDMEGQKTPCLIKAVLDLTEHIDSKSEDMTIKTEDLKTSYQYEIYTGSTVVLYGVIENLNTSDLKRNLYLGEEIYKGAYHQHYSGRIMSGAIHTKDSRRLSWRSKP